MSTIEARKKAEKKYHDSVKHISIALKKDSEKYNGEELWNTIME